MEPVTSGLQSRAGRSSLRSSSMSRTGSGGSRSCSSTSRARLSSLRTRRRKRLPAATCSRRLWPSQSVQPKLRVLGDGNVFSCVPSSPGSPRSDPAWNKDDQRLALPASASSTRPIRKPFGRPSSAASRSAGTTWASAIRSSTSASASGGSSRREEVDAVDVVRPLGPQVGAEVREVWAGGFGIGAESVPRPLDASITLPRTAPKRPRRRVLLHEKAPFPGAFSEADAGTRTPDPIITSDVLYQLSYVGGSPKL